jgi:hypothetical protein
MMPDPPLKPMSGVDFEKWRRGWEQEQAWKAAWEKKHAPEGSILISAGQCWTFIRKCHHFLLFLLKEVELFFPFLGTWFTCTSLFL